MNRRFSSIAHLFLTVVTSGLLLAGTCAAGQSNATVHIPFAFTANHQTLPAGHYTLELLSDRFLCFSDSATGRHRGVILVQPESGQYIETRGRLRFRMRGDRHYLTEIRFAGSSMHSIPVIQQNLARELAASEQGGSPIEVGMN